jgi:hypothetical protein
MSRAFSFRQEIPCLQNSNTGPHIDVQVTINVSRCIAQMTDVWSMQTSMITRAAYLV